MPEVCNIENFEPSHYVKASRREEKVVLFYRSHLCPSHPGVWGPHGIEALWVRVTQHCHPRQKASIIFCVVYNLPSATTALLLISHIIDNANDLRVIQPAANLVISDDLKLLNVSDIPNQLYLTVVVRFPPVAIQSSTLSSLS